MRHLPTFISVEPANYCQLHCPECPVGMLYYGTVEKTDLDHRKAGIYHSTIKVALPENAPEGEHKIPLVLKSEVLRTIFLG